MEKADEEGKQKELEGEQEWERGPTQQKVLLPADCVIFVGYSNQLKRFYLVGAILRGPFKLDFVDILYLLYYVF